jgi:hypothetical protein
MSHGLQAAAGIGAAIAMIVGFLVGFVAISQALWSAVGNVVLSSSEAKPAVAELLAGLEWFFLAPLPFLSVHGIIKYFERQHEALFEVKRLVVGQIIAVVATDLVERLAAQSGQVDRDRGIASVSLIVALSAYLWIGHRPKLTLRGNRNANSGN